MSDEEEFVVAEGEYFAYYAEAGSRLVDRSAFGGFLIVLPESCVVYLLRKMEVRYPAGGAFGVDENGSLWMKG